MFGIIYKSRIFYTNIILAFSGILILVSLNFQNSRFGEFHDYIKFIIFIVVMLIINWRKIAGLIKNYGNLDIIDQNKDNKIYDESWEYQLKEGGLNSIIIAFIMLLIMYSVTSAFPDFMFNMLYGPEEIEKFSN